MATQEQRDAGFTYQDTRANFKEILGKRSDLAQSDGGRIAAPGSGTVLYNAGLVLGLASSGAFSGFYEAYNSSNTDGSQVAVGVLAEDTLVDSTGYGSEIKIYRVATLLKDLLIGLDSGAITSLNGHSFVEHGVNLIRINA